MRELPHNCFQSLPADNIAVGDAEHLPPLEPAQGSHHSLWIGGRCQFPLERRPQHCALLRPSLPHPHFLPRFRIGDDEVSQMRARGKNPDQDLQRLWGPLKQRGCRQGAAHRGQKTLQRHKHLIWIPHGGQERGQTGAEHRQQVEREPLVGHSHQGPLGRLRILEPGCPAPCFRTRRVFQ